MSDNQFDRLQEMFHQLADRTPPEQRAQLDVLQATDQQLARDLERLLACDSTSKRETPAPSQASPVSPSRQEHGDQRAIGPYRLVRKLGEGGMGTVWEARQTEPVERTVALKVLRTDRSSSHIVKRFFAERQALALMDHPNIASAYDSGTTTDGAPWFAMELIDGRPITEHCDHAHLSLNDRIGLFSQLCMAVQHAHRRGIIHRDLKPSNVLVAASDDNQDDIRIKVIDFGIAKAVEQPLAAGGHTLAGDIVGTPEYMSPEQAGLEGGIVDTRTDVYALGVILYELLVGDVPISSETLRKAGIEEMRRQIREAAAPKPSSRITQAGERTTDIAHNRATEPTTLRRRVRGDLDWIVLKALEKSKDRRYESPHALAEDLARYTVNDPVLAGPPTLSYRLRKLVQKHKKTAAAAAVVLASIVLGITGSAVGLARAKAAERISLREARTSEEVTKFLTRLLGSADPARDGKAYEMTARELLFRGVERVDQLDDEPHVKARVMKTLGEVLTSVGEYDQARELLENALQFYQQLDTKEPQIALDKAQVFNALGVLEARHLDHEGAAKYHRQALALWKKHLPPDDSKIALSLNNLGLCLSALEQHDEAAEMLQRSLQLCRQKYGEKSMECTAVLNNIASVSFRSGDFREASRAYESILVILRKTIGTDHPQFATILNNKAAALAKLGMHRVASTLRQQSINIYRDKLGDRHGSGVGQGLTSLADSQRALGDYPAALASLDEAMSILVESFGSTSKNAATVWLERGDALVQMGSLDQAQDAYQRALAIEAPLENSFHDSRMIFRIAKLAHVERRRNNLEESEKLCLEALQEFAPNPYASYCFIQLASVYYLRGSHDRATEYFSRLPDNPKAAKVPLLHDPAGSFSLAGYAVLTGDHEQAFALLAHSLGAGFSERFTLHSPDFEALHTDPRWTEFSQSLETLIESSL